MTEEEEEEKTIKDIDGWLSEKLVKPNLRKIIILIRESLKNDERKTVKKSEQV